MSDKIIVGAFDNTGTLQPTPDAHRAWETYHNVSDCDYSNCDKRDATQRELTEYESVEAAHR